MNHPSPSPIKRCPTCTRTRNDPAYCAPARCYCGHPDCPAAASYYKPPPITATVTQRTEPSAWDERDKDSKHGWIDQM